MKNYANFLHLTTRSNLAPRLSGDNTLGTRLPSSQGILPARWKVGENNTAAKRFAPAQCQCSQLKTRVRNG